MGEKVAVGSSKSWIVVAGRIRLGGDETMGKQYQRKKGRKDVVLLRGSLKELYKC